MCHFGSTFNGSIWHALWVLSPLAIVVFLVCSTGLLSFVLGFLWLARNLFRG